MRPSSGELMEKWARSWYGRDRGLNADWAVSAWIVSGRDFVDGIYLIDNEDDTWSVVRRIWSDDGESVVQVLFTGSASAVRKHLRPREARRANPRPPAVFRLPEGRAKPANVVILLVRNYYGDTIGEFARKYNGTRKDMVRQMFHLEKLIEDTLGWSGPNNPQGINHINSFRGATDRNGRPAWVISPNGRHVARAGSREARYILGDLSAMEGA